jgi:membrane-associated phospholipid phosphatase
VASPGPAIVVGCIGLLLVAMRREPGALGGLIIACLAVPLNALMKFAYGPTELWVSSGRGGTNFPSGHASFVTAVIGYFGLLCWRRGSAWRLLTLLAAVLVVGVGPARVVGGEHLVSDVVGGYLLGGAMLVLAGVWLVQGGAPGIAERWRRASANVG